MQAFESKGLWWLPENPEEQINGTLSFSPQKGGILQLDGVFTIVSMNPVLAEDDFNKPHKIILGYTQDNQKITLYNCYSVNTTISGISTQAFHIGVILQGNYCQKEEDLLFNEITIEYSYLNEWINRTKSFDIQDILDDENKLISQTISYKPATDRKLKISDNCIVILGFDYSSNVRGFLPLLSNEISLKEQTYIKILPDTPLNLNGYFEYFFHIQNFFSLGIGQAVYPLSIYGKINQQHIEVFYKIPSYPSLFEKINIYDMLFCYKDIYDDIETCLSNWFDKSDLLEPVYQLYFGTLYNTTMYPQQEFLSLIQAVETYHRRKNPNNGKSMKNDDFEIVKNKIISLIPNDVDEKTKTNITKSLDFANEINLNKRLEELFKKHKFVLEIFINKLDSLPFHLSETRHYYTHFNQNKEAQAKKGTDLYTLVKQLKFVLDVLMLSELGLSNDRIKQIIESSTQKYQYLHRNKQGIKL